MVIKYNIYQQENIFKKQYIHKCIVHIHKCIAHWKSAIKGLEKPAQSLSPPSIHKSPTRLILSAAAPAKLDFHITCYAVKFPGFRMNNHTNFLVQNVLRIRKFNYFCWTVSLLTSLLCRQVFENSHRTGCPLESPNQALVTILFCFSLLFSIHHIHIHLDGPAHGYCASPSCQLPCCLHFCTWPGWGSPAQGEGRCTTG